MRQLRLAHRPRLRGGANYEEQGVIELCRPTKGYGGKVAVNHPAFTVWTLRDRVRRAALEEA